MFQLGLHLALKSGREAFTRLLLTTIAVTIGVVVLLSVVSDFHAFLSYIGRPYWEGTQAMANQQPTDTSNVELWNYSQDFYKGQTIERLDVAALGPDAPVLPGLTKMPSAGQFYASPALISLLHSVPSDELGNRFPGSLVGTIGNKALSDPSALVIVIGYTPTQLASLPSTVKIDQISTASESSWSWSSPGEASLTKLSSEVEMGLSVGSAILLFPMLVLIGTATRLSAARREERYAAMRLVGFTSKQINIIASIDAMVSAFLGTIIGISIFVLIKPSVANLPILDATFFPQTVTPTAIGYLAVLIGVPIVSALLALRSLRRVKISPLGVSRKVRQGNPKIWGLIPLLIGIVLFIIVIAGPASGAEPMLALVLVMIGLLTSGPWLTMQTTRLLSRFTRGTASLIAARHLANSPKVAFRMVSGIMLAVFVGTIVATLAPAVLVLQPTAQDSALSNVLRTDFIDQGSLACGAQNTSTACYSGSENVLAAGLPPQEAHKLLSQLQSYSGVTVIPFYSILQNQKQLFAANVLGDGGPGGPHSRFSNGPGPNSLPNYSSVVSCAALSKLPVLGTCSSGAKAVEVYTNIFMTVTKTANLNGALPLVSSRNPAVSDNFSDMYLSSLLVKTNNSNTLEKVRTLLTTYSAMTASSSRPETFGEIQQNIVNTYDNARRVLFITIGITVLVAGCSLAINLAGSLLERKHPFTLLRLSGISKNTLARAIMLESVLPLLIVSLVAASVGYVLGMEIVKDMTTRAGEAAASAPILGASYYFSVGAGLLISLAIVLGTLPLLYNITRPENARFE